jgi:hypothetical protein
MTAWDIAFVRLFAPVPGRVDPYIDVGGGLAFFDPARDRASIAGGTVRASIGLDAWITRQLTLGLAGIYRVNFVDETVGHAGRAHRVGRPLVNSTPRSNQSIAGAKDRRIAYDGVTPSLACRHRTTILLATCHRGLPIFDASGVVRRAGLGSPTTLAGDPWFSSTFLPTGVARSLGPSKCCGRSRLHISPLRSSSSTIRTGGVWLVTQPVEGHALARDCALEQASEGSAALALWRSTRWTIMELAPTM